MLKFLLKNIETNQANLVKYVVSIVSLGILGIPTLASAATISTDDALVLSQSVVSDLDYLALGEFFGVDDTKNNYSFILNESTYTGKLSGTYLGESLDVNYFGDFADFIQTGTITYNSQGFFGDEQWSGIGTIEITEKSGNEFNFELDSLLNIGSNTVETNGFFLGTVNNNSFSLTNESGTINFNSQDNQQTTISLQKPGSDLKQCKKGERKSEFSYTKEAENLYLSEEMIFECKVVPKARLEFRKVETRTVLNDINFNPIAGTGGGSIQLAKVPEPTFTIALLALGTLGVGSTLLRKQKQKKINQ